MSPPELPEQGDEFTCAACKGKFVAARPQLEKIAESENTFGVTVTPETHETVCDNCWQELVAWHKQGMQHGKGEMRN